ncbi:MAG: hypothetical protein MI784_02175 [Cytophagales bacterium]|nr:hypothetical protein [Cytophagales bacterium]
MFDLHEFLKKPIKNIKHNHGGRSFAPPPQAAGTIQTMMTAGEFRDGIKKRKGQWLINKIDEMLVVYHKHKEALGRAEGHKESEERFLGECYHSLFELERLIMIWVRDEKITKERLDYVGDLPLLMELLKQVQEEREFLFVCCRHKYSPFFRAHEQKETVYDLPFFRIVNVSDALTVWEMQMSGRLIEPISGARENPTPPGVDFAAFVHSLVGELLSYKSGIEMLKALANLPGQQSPAVFLESSSQFTREIKLDVLRGKGGRKDFFAKIPFPYQTGRYFCRQQPYSSSWWRKAPYSLVPFLPVMYLAKIVLERLKSVESVKGALETGYWINLLEEMYLEPVDFSKPFQLLNPKQEGWVLVDELFGPWFPDSGAEKEGEEVIERSGTLQEPVMNIGLKIFSFRHLQEPRWIHRKSEEAGSMAGISEQFAPSENNQAQALDVGRRSSFDSQILPGAEVGQMPVIEQNLRSILFPSQPFDIDQIDEVCLARLQEVYAWVINVKLSSGEEWLMKLPKENLRLFKLEKEAFAANFLNWMGVRVKGQTAWLLGTFSDEFDRLVLRIRKKVKGPFPQLMQWLESSEADAQHVLFVKEPAGMPLKELMAVESRAKGDRTMIANLVNALGELIVYDILMGNSERAAVNVFPESFFGYLFGAGKATGKWEASGHSLNVAGMHEFLQSESLADYSEGGEEIETILLDPMGQHQNIRRILGGIELGIRRFFESFLQLISEGKAGRIPYTRNIISRSASLRRLIDVSDSILLDKAIVDACMRWEERKELMSEVARLKAGSFAIEFNAFLRNWGILAELVGSRKERLVDFLRSQRLQE